MQYFFGPFFFWLQNVWMKLLVVWKKAIDSETSRFESSHFKLHNFVTDANQVDWVSG